MCALQWVGPVALLWRQDILLAWFSRVPEICRISTMSQLSYSCNLWWSNTILKYLWWFCHCECHVFWFSSVSKFGLANSHPPANSYNMIPSNQGWWGKHVGSGSLMVKTLDYWFEDSNPSTVRPWKPPTLRAGPILQMAVAWHHWDSNLWSPNDEAYAFVLRHSGTLQCF